MSVTVDAMFAELESTPDRPRTQLTKIRYSHEAMIDLILTNPAISNNELAARFGYSASWVSTIQQTDAFQTALAAKRERLVDPILRSSLEEQMKGMTARSMEVIQHHMNKLPENIPIQVALKVFDLSSRAAGYGVKAPAAVVNLSVSQHIESHGDQLVNLLRRKKAEVICGDILNEETLS